MTTPLNWVDWALAHGPAQPSQRLVLIVLARHADKTGLAYPSESRLLRVARVGRATFYRALVSLAKHGLLEGTTGPRRQRAWRLVLGAGASTPPPPPPKSRDVDAQLDAVWQALGLPAGGRTAPCVEDSPGATCAAPAAEGGEEQAMFSRCENSPALRLDDLAPAGGLPLAGLSWGRHRRWARLGLPAPATATGVSA